MRELRAEDTDFFLQTLTVGAIATDDWSATVYIEGHPITCKLDTGANCCVISRSDVAKLPDKRQQACNVKLTAFFGHTTAAHAQVHLTLSANARTKEQMFFIVEEDVPATLSGAAAESLGFIYRMRDIQQELYPPVQPFADVFEGLGQLKDFEYDMKLKPGAVGVVVPARRVPVALQDKVKAELQRMETQGVITKPEVRYLGHILSTEGLRLDPGRVKDILEMEEPKNSSQQRLRDLRAATNDDPALVKLRGYAETSWPEKREVPESVRQYWSYKEELHTQDGLVFRSNKRLMGRQTRTLLPVPTSHLEPEAVPSKAVHSRLQEIRQSQKVYYNRGTNDLPPLSPGQPVSTYPPANVVACGTSKASKHAPPAEAWQPQFDPPLPPFRTYNLESWFEEFAVALELNGIWLQAFMFEVLEYHLPRDLKRSLTYFAWRPRPYDDLRDAVLEFYGIAPAAAATSRRHPRQQANPQQQTNPHHGQSELFPSR
ncbi:uncharacterized protein LOC125757341 [Rhipicephalus sanguineus]|uniref:uncharacterized protein LOC125757341 n=1 Tax=Rhipicephalus sanguineus TaxID=34632 RepID=UPI0020C4BCAB|nr:uncharacterized protein LOC125757341 [Rhipicephalus sanguineus]